MPRIPLSGGTVAAIEVRHTGTRVRMIVLRRDSTKAVRVALTPEERDQLVGALTSNEPGTPSFCELVRGGHFAAAAGYQVRAHHDGEDRIQDAVAQTWVMAHARIKAFRPELPERAMYWIFNRRVRSTRDRFVRTKVQRGADALDPSVRARGHVCDVDVDAMQMTGFNPEELFMVKELLGTLTDDDLDLLELRGSGHTLAEVAKETGTSVATAHRRCRRLAERVRGS